MGLKIINNQKILGICVQINIIFTIRSVNIWDKLNSLKV